MHDRNAAQRFFSTLLPRPSAMRAGLLILLFAVGWAPTALAESGSTRLGDLSPQHEARGPGHTFPSLRLALFDAMQFGRELPAVRRGRIAAGAIERVPGGFSYAPPRTSRRAVSSTRAPRLRLSLRQSTVASFVIRPESGRIERDRLNSELTPSERRYVDEVDRSHRPIYLLTPSREIIRYGDAPGTAVVSLDGGPLPLF